ncbi:MAG: hypothetical protein DRJ05_07275 [Bacteroidetes bacterium]|nr:MAG: hypothetical protein DRJ05_07275 [Bacteroidota bacterium]
MKQKTARLCRKEKLLVLNLVSKDSKYLMALNKPKNRDNQLAFAVGIYRLRVTCPSGSGGCVKCLAYATSAFNA